MSEAAVFAPGLFVGRHVLITGGATGLGYAMAELLGGLGAKVTIASRNLDTLKDAAARLTQIGIDAGHCRVDIRDTESVAALFADLAAGRGLPDHLVNNAGGQFSAAALDITPNGFRAVTDLNLQGTWQMSQSFAKAAIAARRPGRIVNIVFAHTGPMAGFAHAAAARAGVVNLTRTLALEWGRNGILVNAVGAGTMETEALARYADADAWREAAKRQPVPRLGQPRDLALAVAYLLSPAGDYVTGTLLTLDGGESLLRS
jgi:peroxisomal trans-2-enoyl-CoA reductase